MAKPLFLDEKQTSKVQDVIGGLKLGVKSKKMIEKYMKKGEMEAAKIHAENAIRQKNESVQYLRLSARLDAVSQRVKSALSQHQMSNNMKQVVSSLSGVLSSMDVEKISKTMDQFETQFEDLDVRTKFMDSAIASTTASATPQDAVTSLMNEAGETIGIQVSEDLDQEGVPISMPISEESEVKEGVAIGGDNENSAATGGKGTDVVDDLQARFDPPPR